MEKAVQGGDIVHSLEGFDHLAQLAHVEGDVVVAHVCGGSCAKRLFVGNWRAAER